MNNNGDPLASQLRREALAERPAFSSSLHERILDRVDEEGVVLRPRRISPLRWLAAAAAIALVGGITATWLTRSRPASGPNNVVATSKDAPRRFTVDLHGLLYANVSPEGVTIRSPIGEGRISSAPQPPQAKPAQTALVPASPEWLLAQLQAPASSAKLALADVIPPQILELTGWPSAQR